MPDEDRTAGDVLDVAAFLRDHEHVHVAGALMPYVAPEFVALTCSHPDHGDSAPTLRVPRR